MNVEVDKQEISRVQDSIHLGQTISVKGKMEKEIERRIMEQVVTLWHGAHIHLYLLILQNFIFFSLYYQYFSPNNNKFIKSDCLC